MAETSFFSNTRKIIFRYYSPIFIDAQEFPIDNSGKIRLRLHTSNKLSFGTISGQKEIAES